MWRSLCPGSSVVHKQMAPELGCGESGGWPSGLRAEQPPRSRSKSRLSQTFLGLYNECPCQQGLTRIFPKNEKSFKIIYGHCKKIEKKRSQLRKLSFDDLSSLPPPTSPPPTPVPTQNCVFLSLVPRASPNRGGTRREG